MSHWKDAAVTNDGVEMLNEWMAGRFIRITSAYGGTGTVDAAFLTEQTDLVERRQQLHLLGEEDNAKGKTVQIQVSNAEVMEEYELNQVGVYAKLDPERDPDAEERLLFIMQDQKGVTIPSAMDASFMLELYAMIGITNNGRFDVSVSAAGVVTMAYLREFMARTLQAHNADSEAHPEIREQLANVSANNDSVENAVAEVDARLTLLELMYRTQVSGNPFTVTFDNMDSLLVTGVWNAAMKRVEF